MDLGTKITYLRTKNGCSQEMLADYLNVSRQTVSKWELGTSIPQADKIIGISDFFQVSTDFLLREDFNADSASSLDRIVIRFINSAQDMKNIADELVNIARDGVIDKEERKRLVSLLDSVTQIEAVIDEMRHLLT